MYRMLIVDDEEEVLDGLLNIFEDMNHLELELFAAGSAEQAIHVLEQIKIDIVLTDIRMPEVDGIEMYDTITERWPRCRVIFLSGVRDFDYVYRSVQNKNVRYLTKMEPEKKIIDTVRDVMRDIDHATQLDGALEQAKAYYRQALPLLREQLLRSLLEGDIDSALLQQRELEELDIFLDVRQPVLLFGMCLDGSDIFARANSTPYPLFALQALCDNYVGDHTKRTVYYVDRGFLICLAQFPNLDVSPSFAAVRNGIFEGIQASTRQNLNTTVSIAYSGQMRQLDGLAEPYAAIRQTLGYAHSLFTEGILEATLRPAGEYAKIDVQGTFRHYPFLENSLDLGNKSVFLEHFAQMTNELSRLESMNCPPALEIYLRIATLLLKYINLWNLQETVGGASQLERLTRLDYHSSWEEAVNDLRGLAIRIIDAHAEDEGRRYRTDIASVKDYIDHNLDKDLSLNVLADRAGLHPSYLSRLFKLTMQQTLYGYILDLRMNEAKHLLRHTANRIHEIAQMVGYDNPQSFNRAFKKYTGNTPNEFRLDSDSI